MIFHATPLIENYKELKKRYKTHAKVMNDVGAKNLHVCQKKNKNKIDEGN